MRDHRLQTARILLLGSVLAVGLQAVLPVAVGAEADGGSLSQALVFTCALPSAGGTSRFSRIRPPVNNLMDDVFNMAGDGSG